MLYDRTVILECYANLSMNLPNSYMVNLHEIRMGCGNFVQRKKEDGCRNIIFNKKVWRTSRIYIYFYLFPYILGGSQICYYSSFSF